MSDDDGFERLRPQLLRLAYSQLGSLSEAEDVVQEAWLRLQRTDQEAIDDLRAWLTTVVGRLSLDAMRSARVRREQYIGPWLPDPLVETPSSE
ncbi:MAG: RNA polymerase sigma-70 factor, partial [Solirubrobacterales bacterium]|nr:RNA polymerase sigma-70 factor [Solirubrobacterales bacterium]